jgi:TRAP-type C4-dicarboxylate transport system substrate-binding protein
MNKRVWEKIPDDLKPMVTEEIRRMNALPNKINDDNLERDMKIMEKAGIEVYTLPPEEVARWNQTLKPTVDKWVEDLEAKGLPAKKVLNIYREECQKRGIGFPY